MTITLIAAVDTNYGIGDSNNNLLYKIPNDLQRFKEITTNHKIIMGRKTWDSLPNKPLKNRINYVLTRDERFRANGAMPLNSLDEIKYIAENEEIFIIGGAELYHQTIDMADKMYLTYIFDSSKDAATYFPKFSYMDWNVDKSVLHVGYKYTPTYNHTTFSRRKKGE